MTIAVNLAVDYAVTTAPTGTSLGGVTPFAPVGRNALVFVPAALPASTVVAIQGNSVATAGDAGWTTLRTLETGNIGVFEVTGLQEFVRVLVTDSGTGTGTISIVGIQ